MTGLAAVARRDHATRRADRAGRPSRGFWARHRFLILRRLSQATALALFLTGPLFGVWIAKGTLAASMTFGVVPLTDPLMLAQSLVAGHRPETLALTGGAIVLAFYALVSGRAYCAWVCPIDPVTDLAHWCRERLGLQAKGWQPRPQTRLWVLAMILAVSAVTGTIAWELVNPISFAFRAVVFGSTGALTLVAAVFLFDLVVARRGWCSHLCPVGAFYGLIGARSLVRVSAAGRADCDHCMDCYAACPEPQVIAPALEGAAKGASPVILGRDCSSCGRCVDVCPAGVFRFTHRFDASTTPAGSAARSHSSGETP
ncbi:quinol dehydrogenase ferredoxin subunit NapH [Siculibacillus lacustris]|uniref:Quinol dehydrogenase ferredoxin subunit NapH n=1 Tax=Siculibacillus lacustris TaxID=1549641 RepID=A0A4Q9VY42_9HYPH|nr:quinol dehydrogenase ferredoxin subunit NapH [Siculibacillus lacustris]TBW40298.1 quinol dehydrogenase ferredoxin subunit NapH [Siculibacillus lacustris]